MYDLFEAAERREEADKIRQTRNERKRMAENEQSEVNGTRRGDRGASPRFNVNEMILIHQIFHLWNVILVWLLAKAAIKHEI